MKAKSLITYKIGYDPDKKQKSKSVEVEYDGATQNFVIPIVSGKKDLKFMVNKQLPPYNDLASALEYTGQDKFNAFGQYLSGAFKSAWEQEVAEKFFFWFIA